MLRYISSQPEAQAILAEWGATDTAELEALPDEELFVRWLRASSLEARTRIAFREVSPRPAPTVQRFVLGTVSERPDLAHVLYREIVAGGSALRIASLRQTVEGWKLGIDDELLGYSSYHFGPAPPPG